MSIDKNGLRLVVINKNEAHVCFGKEHTSWNVFPYFKGTSGFDYDVFEQVNDYIQTIDRSQQEIIYAAYKSIYDLLEYPPQDLDQKLRDLVTDFINLLDLSRIKNWIDLKANVVVPTGIDENYVPTDENTGNRDRTYIREDYKWLVALSVLLRFVTPIWGEYIGKTSREKGNNFKEYYAADLIKNSYIMKSEPMQKLKTFVLENIPVEKPLLSTTLAAFSEEDFPEWVVRLVVVKKLAIEDIRGLNNDSHLIKVIFQFVRQRLRNIDSSFYGPIKEKFREESSSSGDDTNNLSKIEGYKIRQELSAGDIAFIRKSLSDPMTVALKLNPAIDEKMILDSIRSVKRLERVSLEKAQRALLQYVMKPVISPQGLFLLKKLQLVDMLGVAQAVLWNAEWYDMASLMTAVRIKNDDYMSVSPTGVRSRITKAQIEKLDYLYPYTKRPQGKQKIVRNQNVAISEIERLNDNFLDSDWRLCIPQVWINRAKLEHKAARYTTPFDLRIRLADFVIAIAENRLPFDTSQDSGNSTKSI